jgi:hypoxanthine phosphoribosyltransferase
MEKKKVGFGEIKKIIDEFIVGEAQFLAGIDFVVGVSRGGLAPAALLAARINKPLTAVYINKQDEIFFDRTDWINGKNILVVDDIIRSGKTLWLVKNHLEANSAPKSISFFTLFKVGSLFNDNCDIKVSAREIDEDVIFPWDDDVFTN